MTAAATSTPTPTPPPSRAWLREGQLLLMLLLLATQASASPAPPPRPGVTTHRDRHCERQGPPQQRPGRPSQSQKVYTDPSRLHQPSPSLGRRRAAAIGLPFLLLGVSGREPLAAAKVVYGEDITAPELDRDFGPDETVQADAAWEAFRLKKKAGLANVAPTKPSLSPSRYLGIIYALKDQSFSDLKDYLRRAILKDTVSQMQNEFRRMDVALVQDAFDEMRQSMYYLPSAVAQRNTALGYNLQRRYNVVEVCLETLDRDLNLLSYGRSDITDDDIRALKQSLNDLETSTNIFTEYATKVVSQL